MKPILVWLHGLPLVGDLPIRGYGAFVGISLLVVMGLGVRYARKQGLPHDRFLDASFLAILGGLVGGRVMYVLVHAREFEGDPMAAFKVWQGGMMYFGGLLLGIAVGVGAAWRLGVRLWPALDCIAPTLGIGQAIGRLGCLVAGCCYGPASDSRFAMAFGDPAAAIPPSLRGVPLVPVQLLQVLEGGVLWALGWWAFRRRRFDGEAFVAVLGLAGLTRIVLEGLRADEARGFLLPALFGDAISSSRAVGGGMIAVALGIWLWRRGASAPRAETRPAV